MLGRPHDGGSTSAIGLIVAGAIFATAFVGAQLLVAQPGGADLRPAALEIAASNALGVIISQPGSATGGVPWETQTGVDTIQRFGLASQSEPNFLDYVKIKALRNGTMTAAINKAPDYPDVRAALGIREGDFHIRSYPVLPGLDDPRWSKEQHGRLAYFAHYTGATAPGSLATFVNVTASSINVSLAIRNDGIKSSVFVANIGLGDRAGGSTPVSEQRHTTLLAPGHVQTVWVEFPLMKAWNDNFNGVRVELVDAYANVIVAPSWRDAIPPEGGTRLYAVKLAANQLYYESGQSVEFTADHYDGNGAHLNADQTGRFVLFDPSGTEIFNETVTLPKGKNKVYEHKCTTCTAVGTYRGVLWDKDIKIRSADSVYVAPTKMFNEKKTLDPVAIREIQIIQDLVEGFNALRFDAAEAPDGDIFGDDSNGPHGLATQLDRYTTIIIGSEVSQTALNSAATKYGIAQWVQEGGNLIVLGTYNQQSNWLEPVYHAAQITANGGIGTPDPTHPVLSTPNRLNYKSYLDRARAWDIENDAPFTHVLTRGAGGTSMIDTLAIAAPGAYNDGTVVLTSYMPGALTDPQDDMEAKRFLHNLMAQSYNMLYIDYGPAVPDGTPVGSAQRLVAVPHPNVPGAVVEVRVVMYVFG